ncbi:MAG TPA: OsmC family protein [Terracidiphilus sp.]
MASFGQGARVFMELTVRQIEGVQFEVQARSHRITCDQPTENGGANGGMTPPELLLASLGSCAAFYAAEYLRTRNLAKTGVEVTVTAEKLLKPARVGNFRVMVTSPIALTAEQNEGLTRSVHHCLVHNTLMAPPEINIEIAAAVAR